MPAVKTVVHCTYNGNGDVTFFFSPDHLLSDEREGWEAGVRALLECKADVEARDEVRSGRGGLRFRAGKECQAVVFSKGSAECGRERSRISAA